MSIIPAAEPKTGFAARAHFQFLDGIRGLAALTVMCCHIINIAYSAAPVSQMSPALRGASHLIQLGHCAVCAFIVLSGFCLMLPVAGAPARQLAGGLKGFAARRARRILPPYYAALALTILLPAIHATVVRLTNHQHEPFFLPVRASNLISHLLLVHNLRADLLMALDGPTWSVATEWQIYFVFALVLLPLWRRFGGLPTFFGAVLLGTAPYFVLPANHNFAGSACSWLLGLFAMGMLGATMIRSESASVISFRRRMHWGAIAAISAVLIYPIYIFYPSAVLWRCYWLLDFFAGLPILCLILYCGQFEDNCESKPSIALRVLNSKAAQAVGAFSYSLYLIHVPLLEQIDRFLPQGLSADERWGMLAAIGLPLVLAAAYLFYLAVERPFLRQNRRHREPSMRSAL
ncbi:hypothetical protein CCAX7_14130 [Capsulimonas corticalis]|uniref:Uncharacterized protein n=1 Tax=Capsulimonas corticalis TaxID=2219043 RepID=A0A402D706_9BACT|nr:acyltransferase [Capsulimonas corticalis]BDI29362.1 hypothetical protein CCAX7_14130 [Capsulimonas corticalis]